MTFRSLFHTSERARQVTRRLCARASAAFLPRPGVALQTQPSRQTPRRGKAPQTVSRPRSSADGSHDKATAFQGTLEDYLSSVDKLRQLIEDKVHILQPPSATVPAACLSGAPGRLLQPERLFFQEEALSALRNPLTQDLHSEETHGSRPSDRSMQGKNELEMEQHAPGSSSPNSPLSPHQTTNKEEALQAFRASHKKPATGLSFKSNLHRASSIKDLISKFSGPDQVSSSRPPKNPTSGRGRVPKSATAEVLSSSRSTLSASDSALDGVGRDKDALPSITVTPPIRETQNLAQSAQRGPDTSKIVARIDCPVGASAEKTDSEPRSKAQPTESGRDSGVGSESELDLNKQSESPSEEEPTTPRVMPATQNPKYQLFLNSEHKTNGLSGSDGPGGGGMSGDTSPRPARWETTRLGGNHFRGSLESLASRDWDNTSDKSSKYFNNPYGTTSSIDYNSMNRMSEFKVPGRLSPANSEMNMYNFNGRSISPVGTTPINSVRPRYSAYDSLVKRRGEVNNTVTPTTHYSMRSNTLGAPNKKNFIEELTKQMEACQKRNQFLEAESVEMEKERSQIRFEMRGLLVNNEDLLRTNAQLNSEMKRMREQMIEMQRENQSVVESYKDMEIEVKQAREIRVEANNQEYAFGFLQQSLQNQINDAEENLEKQTQHAQTLSEKLWQAERQLEELEIHKDSRDKKASELNSTILRMESELSEALLVSTQATAQLSLQQKLREDSERRVEELEESMLEKDQELQRLQTVVGRLHGEVSDKLIDKERTLEDEIQLREKIQLQCKQAERTVDDLTMELQSTNQAREELAKQVKLAQEKMIDLESDLEELHDSELRWASKHKRAIEQIEQLQLKVIQEKDLNDQLETDKVAMERQLRELRMEVEELQSSRVQEDVVSRAESRVKELENTLRTEERNKSVLTNTISKLERRINELSDQMEEEHRIATEQKDLMTQRMRSLKRQVNEAEEEASRKEAQYRHTQRELAEERETSGRLQRQLLDQHMQTKRKETLNIRQTLDNLRLDLSVDDEGDDQLPQQPQTASVTEV